MNGARARVLLSLLLLVAASFIPIFTSTTYAAQITARSLTLIAGASDGGSKALGVVNHLFSFTLPSVGNTNVGSIKFEYCTTAANTPAVPACVTPTGIVTTSATLSAQSGATGFTVNGTTLATNGAPYITRSAASVTAGTAVTYQLNGVTNPTANNTSFFVRITTYVTNNATGAATDAGTVTASTAEPIVLTGTMPESLVFCTGEQVLTTGGAPDCTTATSGVISFNQLFSPIDTAIAESQMSASTNAGAGYAITVNGATLTSGGNTITAMGTAGASTVNHSQFGINLMANTAAAASGFPGTVAPYISANVAPAANLSGGLNFRGQPKAGYDTADTFKFTSGDTVAASDFTTVGGSDSQIFTVSYIANVPGSQPAGTYSTTLTYICTPTF